ncbi:hypothetical protein B0H15DRAFT_807609 [Mycena belliarum]|uniref:Uncharacterized protein n=1 Tax=Mycena belliarum TaxID=1033014 RepID=A0AAD6XFP9_9AGAR|nr:hypothetical protein B0H15DRAFT_807609 [Mycena belliae]
MPPFASFCGEPVSTGFNGCAVKSCVSLDWVINLGLSTRGSQISGPLILPCNAGTISISLLNVPVTASLPAYDLVLGLDWLNLVPNLGKQVVVHLSCGSVDLQSLASVSALTPLSPPVLQASISACLPVSFHSFQSIPNLQSIEARASGVTCTQETQTSCARDVISDQDVPTAGTPATRIHSFQFIPNLREIEAIVPEVTSAETQTSRIQNGSFGQDVQTTSMTSTSTPQPSRVALGTELSEAWATS